MNVESSLALVYDVFGNKAPVSWRDETVSLLFSKIKFSEPRMKSFVGTPSAFDLATKMLEKDPLSRIDIDAALSHPFFSTEKQMESANSSEADISAIVGCHMRSATA